MGLERKFWTCFSFAHRGHMSSNVVALCAALDPKFADVFGLLLSVLT